MSKLTAILMKPSSDLYSDQFLVEAQSLDLLCFGQTSSCRLCWRNSLFFEIAWNTRHLIATQFMPCTNNTTDDPPEGARWASTQKILLSMCLHELEPHASASSGPAAPGVLFVACHQCVQCVWNTLKLWIKTLHVSFWPIALPKPHAFKNAYSWPK
jgi:hypothetical protein